MELLAPDGYYKYLGITKRTVSNTDETQQQQHLLGNTPATAVDLDQVKKNYRKLSLKHHPDKRGGDAETFRVLNRAQHVLSSPKLRKQYDTLGIDLDDDEQLHAGGGDEANTADSDKNDTSTAEGIVQEIASMALTSLMQLGVRTGVYF